MSLNRPLTRSSLILFLAIFAAVLPAGAGAQANGTAASKSKRIVAVQGPLSDVIADVSRHFNGEIILADENMGGRIVSGAYDLDNPALALHTLVSPLGGLVTEVTPWMLIVSSK